MRVTSVLLTCLFYGCSDNKKKEVKTQPDTKTDQAKIDCNTRVEPCVKLPPSFYAEMEYLMDDKSVMPLKYWRKDKKTRSDYPTEEGLQTSINDMYLLEKILIGYEKKTCLLLD